MGTAGELPRLPVFTEVIFSVNTLLRQYLSRRSSVAALPSVSPPAPEPESFSRRAVRAILEAPGLQRRDGQLKMACAVAQVLAGERPERHAAVEAGTGTGKSLAYLVPVMLCCVEKKKRAVVATATKTLQEQIVQKDAPFAAELVKEATGKTPSFAVLYGKVNYLCHVLLYKRLAEIGHLATPEICYLERLAAWLETGGSGLRDDLPAFPDIEVQDWWWSRVSAEDDDADCSGCPLACAFKSARDAAAQADVVVANHHLVAADWLLRQKAGLSLFAAKGEEPPQVLVVDEAHEFLDALRGALEASFTAGRVARLQADALRFLRELAEWADGNGFKQEAEYVREKRAAAEGFTEKEWPGVQGALASLFAALDGRLGARDRLLIFPGSAPRAEAEAAASALDRFFSWRAGLLSYPVRAVEALDAADEGLRRELERFERRCDRLLERADELLAALRRSALAEESYRVKGSAGDTCWYERGRIAAAPVDVSGAARDLWRRYEHVILTSATLYPFPQSDGFAWFRQAYGFAEDEVVQGVVASPFRFEEQMRAVVLTDPDLTPVAVAVRERAERRARKLAGAVLRAAEASPGGVLALFTSYREMREVAALVCCKLPPDRPLLVQGEAGKAELLARFREHGRAVLFGVASFWQGVDVPGDALSTLVIAKLPFPQPDDPIVEALCWLAGGDWWRRVSQPLAALTLRQGVGRLIRTETDAGLVVICDPRAAGRHRWFVQSCLPVVPEEREGL